MKDKANLFTGLPNGVGAASDGQTLGFSDVYHADGLPHRVTLVNPGNAQVIMRQRYGSTGEWSQIGVSTTSTESFLMHMVDDTDYVFELLTTSSSKAIVVIGDAVRNPHVGEDFQVGFAGKSGAATGFATL